MKKEPLVSVIIPTKNVEKTFDECLRSIKNQTYKNIEIIVVDNYSSDNSTEIAHRYTKNVYTKGPERSTQKNFGVKKAKGSFIFMMDSDQYAHPNTIEECVFLMKNNNFGALIIPEKSIGNGFWTKVKAYERSFYLNNKYIEAVRFYDKKVYEDVGGFDEDLIGGEDWDLTIRIRKAGYNIGRAFNFLEHDEGTLNLLGSSKKKKYYGDDVFNKYAKKHPEFHRMQMNPFVRFPVKKIVVKGLMHPILFISLIIMKSLEYYYATSKLSSKYSYEK